MIPNLLDTPDLDPPMGDLFSCRTLSETRSIWTTPLPDESGAPKRRIIHARCFTPNGSARIQRIGIRNAGGYHKCGSHPEMDWIVDLRVLTLDRPMGPWRVLLHERDLPEQPKGAVKYFDLQGTRTYGLILEVRRCGIDNWWTPWNLAEGAFLVDGELEDPISPRQETLLTTGNLAITALPSGVTAELRDGTVHYRSPWLEVGFFLSRTGFAYLGIDQDGSGKTGVNLLKIGPGSFHQGSMLNPTGSAPVADRVVRFRLPGRIDVIGNQVRYQIENERTGQHYDLSWTVHTDRLELTANRTGSKEVRAWHSAAWILGLNPLASPVHSLGRPHQHGQTGLAELPAILHAPGHGSLEITTTGPASFRTEVFRPRDRIDCEFKIGELPSEDGDWILPTGEHRTQWEFRVTRPEYPLIEQTPEPVRRALTRTGHTGLNFRPDTGTFSNNGASMHCPISMDTWSAQCLRMGNLLPDLAASELLRYSLERWLDGGPGYASGNIRAAGELHSGEDEYLMTGAAALLGLAEYLAAEATPQWISLFEHQIHVKLEEMHRRDLDDDGLIESAYRTGVSGSGQWSTCWFDVISFGWKDAFTNALLFEALTILESSLGRGPLSNWKPILIDWRQKLRASYEPAFFNPETGWFAGWRCKEDKLHDHAFLPPNGAAVAAGLVSPDRGKAMLTRLLEEMKRVGMPSPRLGLPGNLRCIPDDDLSDIIQGYPFGYYQNGGRTHAQSRHFLRGLYRIGLANEADHLLEELCAGMAEGAVYGGCKSGLDWRYWDGRPSGYEGLLTDQFGFLAVALERYGTSSSDRLHIPIA